MSKTAHQIAQLHAGTTDASKAAEAVAIAKDDFWQGEGFTVYVFDDNSMLVQSGPSQLPVDADNREEVRAYIAFLGDAADSDRERINNMLDAL